MKLISFIQDFTKENTYSALTEISTKEFRNMLIGNTWTEIDTKEMAQRKFITGTAKSRLIKKRLEKDITKGAVLPPIVMGLITNSDKTLTADKVLDLIQKNYKKIFILDGVQRCTNLVAQEGEIKDSTLRIEWWLTNEVDAALDRMLILNFAQNPWDLKQQSKAIAFLFQKSDAHFQKFAESFEKELEKEPHKFLECLFSFQKREPDVYIKDEVSSVFLQEGETKPQIDQLKPFGTVYEIAVLWSQYLPAPHSVRIGICLALADMLAKNPDIDLNKILDWSKTYLESLGENLDNTQNYLDYATLQQSYQKIGSAIGTTSRKMFNIAFSSIFPNILDGKQIWRNPTATDDTKIEVQAIFGKIWEDAYSQV